MELAFPRHGLVAGDTLQAGSQGSNAPSCLQLVNASQRGRDALAHLAVLTVALHKLQVLPGTALFDARVHGTTLYWKNKQSQQPMINDVAQQYFPEITSQAHEILGAMRLSGLSS